MNSYSSTVEGAQPESKTQNVSRAKAMPHGPATPGDGHDNGTGSTSQVQLACALASRMCHDLINPATGLQWGLDFLRDEGEDTRQKGIDNLERSATLLVARLAFFRFAFGASTSLGDDVRFESVASLVRDYFDTEKQTLVWRVQDGIIEKTKARALLILVWTLAGTLTRSGTVIVTSEKARDGDVFSITCAGERVIVPCELERFLEGKSVDCTPRTCHLLLGRELLNVASGRFTYVSTDTELRLILAFPSP